MKRTPLKKKNSTLKKSGTIKKKALTHQQVAERKAQSERDWQFYEEIWNERGPYSEISGTYLGSEVNKACCDHLIEKSIRSDLRYEKDNIILVTIEEHAQKTNGNPHPEHKKRIEDAKKKYGIS